MIQNNYNILFKENRPYMTCSLKSTDPTLGGRERNRLYRAAFEPPLKRVMNKTKPKQKHPSPVFFFFHLSYYYSVWDWVPKFNGILSQESRISTMIWYCSYYPTLSISSHGYAFVFSKRPRANRDLCLPYKPTINP